MSAFAVVSDVVIPPHPQPLPTNVERGAKTLFPPSLRMRGGGTGGWGI